MENIILLQLTADELRSIIREELRAHGIAISKEPYGYVATKNILSLKEACEFTGLCESTMYAMVSKRIVPHYKPGRNLIFKRDELEIWMNSRKRRIRVA